MNALRRALTLPWLALLLFCAKRMGFAAADCHATAGRLNAITIGVDEDAITKHHAQASRNEQALRGALDHHTGAPPCLTT